MRDNKYVLSNNELTVLYYRFHPVQAAKDILNVELNWFQRKTLRTMWTVPFVMNIFGRGSSKCINKDSYILTENDGLIRVKDKFGTELFDVMKENEEKEVIVDSFSIEGRENLKKVNTILYSKGIKTRKLITKKGFVLEGSEDRHKILVMNYKGDFIYKNISKLKIGDEVCIKRRSNIYGKRHIDNKIAYMLGLLIGDGDVGMKNDFSLTTMDIELKNEFYDYFKDYKICNYKKKDKSISYWIFNKKLRQELYENYGLERSKAHFKEVPSSILSANKAAQIEFIAGLYDTDGTLGDDGMFSIVSCSYNLLQQVQLMLLNMGIICSLNRHINKCEGKEFISWNLLSSGAEGRKIQKMINSRLPHKKYIDYNKNRIEYSQDFLPDCLTDIIKNVKVDFDKVKFKTVGKGNIKGEVWSKLKRRPLAKTKNGRLNYTNLNNFIKYFDDRKYSHSLLTKLKNIEKEGFYFDKIKDIEKGKSDCYDFYVPDNNNFWANGFINHNTFINAVFASLYAILYPNTKIMVLGPSKRQGDYIFDEIQKLYDNSEYFQGSLKGKISKPPQGSNCILSNGSTILSLPIGPDGKKIRGARAHVLILDEYAQFDESILKLVIDPFLLVMIGRQNKLVITSSAFYKWNHLYTLFKDYKEYEVKYPNEYRVLHYNYKDVLLDKNSVFKIDMKVIERAKNNNTEVDFNMEYCFPDNELVVTDKGKKFIEDIFENDQILTHTGKYSKVKKKFINNYSGDLISIKPMYSYKSFICTPNHPILVYSNYKYNFKSAKELKNNDLLVTPIVKSYNKKYNFLYFSDFTNNYTKYNFKNEEYIYPNSSQTVVSKKSKYTNYHRDKNFPYKSSLKNRIVIDVSLCRLLGYYLVEGSTSINSVRFHFHEEEKFFIDDVRKIIYSKFGLNSCIFNNKDNKSITIIINSRIFKNFISKIIPGVANTKYIPNLIFNLSNKLKKEFIKGYWRGDGCLSFKSKNTASCSSASIKLSEGLKFLLMTLGIQSSFKMDNSCKKSKIRGREINSGIQYKLEVRGKFLKKLVNWFEEIDQTKIDFKRTINKGSFTRGKYLLTPIKEIKSNKYNGNVHNLLLEKDNTYLVGDGFVVHNCGIFPDNIENFFSSKLVDQCTAREPGRDTIELEKKSDNGDYIVGIDIARSEGGANFVIAVGKDCGTHIDFVHIVVLNGKSYPIMVQEVRKILIKFPVTLVLMDSGGGGQAMKDYLAEPWIHTETREKMLPILDMEDENFIDKVGLKILKMINFHGSKHSSLFVNLKAEMEHNRVWFPLNVKRDKDPEIELMYQNFSGLKTELMIMEAKPKGAYLNFSVPNRFNMDRACAAALVIDGFIGEHKVVLADEHDYENLAVGFMVNI